MPAALLLRPVELRGGPAYSRRGPKSAEQEALERARASGWLKTVRRTGWPSGCCRRRPRPRGPKTWGENDLARGSHDPGARSSVCCGFSVAQYRRDRAA